jgi:hypothetical protein
MSQCTPTQHYNKGKKKNVKSIFQGIQYQSTFHSTFHFTDEANFALRD